MPEYPQAFTCPSDFKILLLLLLMSICYLCMVTISLRMKMSKLVDLSHTKRTQFSCNIYRTNSNISCIRLVAKYTCAQARLTRIYIYALSRKTILNIMLLKAQTLRLFLAPSLHVYWWNFERSLSWLCFFCIILKNERRACDHRVWLLEWPQAPLLNWTAKSGSTASLEFSGFQVESTESLGLRSNRAAELAVT